MSYHKHFHAAERTGICVIRRKGEGDEELLKRFRKKYSKSGISKELRDRMYFEKPSDKKRRKKLQALRAMKREEEKLTKLRKKLERKKMKGRRKKAKGVKYDQSNRRQDRS
jgi:small subunit ribosomal protein S21